MRALAFAARSLVRQPARATLGILGVTAVGALLFDMLLLSQGLIVSMGDLLERTGYNVRVTTTAELPRQAPPRQRATDTVASIAQLPEVRAAIGIRFVDVTIDRPGHEPMRGVRLQPDQAITGTLQGIVGTALGHRVAPSEALIVARFLGPRGGYLKASPAHRQEIA